MNKKYDLVLEVIQSLHAKGFEAYIVGGAVRDRLMNVLPLDYDVSTSALPDQIESLFKKTLPVGKQFGVILVVFGSETIEVATFRKDGDYLDGRRPESVTFCDAKQDVLRRDFTINGLLFDPVKDEIIDWVGGMDDIRNKIIRCIGDPVLRFTEDKLRMLRAIRFSSNLNFTIEQNTWAALLNLKQLISDVSSERIRDEIEKMLIRANPLRAWQHLHDAGLTHLIVPEIFLKTTTLPPLLIALFQKGPFGIESSLARIFLSYYIFMHDIENKNETIRKTCDAYIEFLKNLRFPNKVLKETEGLIQCVWMLLSSEKKELADYRGALGNFLKAGIVEIIRDCEEIKNIKAFHIHKALMETLCQFSQDDLLPPPFIKGDDLIASGMRPSSRFKEILDILYRQQLNDKNADKAQLDLSLKQILDHKH